MVEEVDQLVHSERSATVELGTAMLVVLGTAVAVAEPAGTEPQQPDQRFPHIAYSFEE